jgi:hypothetical protein
MITFSARPNKHDQPSLIYPTQIPYANVPAVENNGTPVRLIHRSENVYQASDLSVA